MSGFGTTPVGTATLATNQFPIAMVAVPNTPAGNLTALEGGPISTDSNGNQTAPVSVYIKDGGNVTQGTSTDAANANTVIGQLKQIKTNTASVTVGVLPALPAGTNVIGSTTIQATSGTALQADQGNTILKASLYGKATTAGDTALLLDALGQVTIEQFVHYQIMQGNGYSCILEGIATNAGNAFVGIQLCANSMSKNALIYRANAFQGQAFGVVRLYRATVATADSNLSASGTAVNHGNNSNASALTSINVSPSLTTQTTGFVGSQLAIGGGAANTLVEMLMNGDFLYLPKNTTCGASIYTKVVTSGNAASLGIFWVEF